MSSAGPAADAARCGIRVCRFEEDPSRFLVPRGFARRIEVVFAAFAVGVRATVTMTRRFPSVRVLTRSRKAACPALLLAFVCARRVRRPAAFERTLIVAPVTR